MDRNYWKTEMNLMQEMSLNLFKKIQARKEQLIEGRLAELGIDFNMEDEAKRRFKSFVVERIGTEEIVYYNDGSIDGKRVITFVTSELDITNKSEMGDSFNITFSYY